MNAGKRREILFSAGEGRNPHVVTLEEYREAGFEPVGATKTIRQKYLDCSGAFTEVKICPAVNCPLWPWRMGTSPKAWKGLHKRENRSLSGFSDHVSPGRGQGMGSNQIAEKSAYDASPEQDDLEVTGGQG